MDCNCLILIGGGLVGLFVGMLTGIFGVGGGFLTTPALIVLLGVPTPIAIGTGITAILFNSSFGMFKRRGTGTIDIKLALVLACGSCVGVLFGLWLLEGLKDAPALVILGREQSAVQYVLLWLFLALLGGTAGFLIYDYRKHQRTANPGRRLGLFSKIQIPPDVHFASLEPGRLSLLPVVFLGLCIGVLTGLLGIGGGVIILPALIYLIGQKTVKAAGTSLLIVWLSSLIAVGGHIKNHNISGLLLIAMIAGGLAGTYFGTHIGLKTSGAKLRYYFIYIVLAAVMMVVWKIYAVSFISA